MIIIMIIYIYFFIKIQKRFMDLFYWVKFS